MAKPESFLFILLFLISSLSLPSTTLSLNKEGLILLQTNFNLPNWNPNHPTPCNWTGITCNPFSAVTSINLPNSQLSTPFPSSLCNLSSLSYLSLPNNNLISSLPQTLSLCTSLKHLNLSLNLLSGPLPETLSLLPSLHHLDLSFNNFSGNIPPSFSLFPSLQTLSLVSNLLTGNIPFSLSNVTTLKKLHLAYNTNISGHIPNSLGNLTNLESLWLSGCSLVGPIPISLGKLFKLRNLDLSQNFLTGGIPVVGGLVNIEQIEVYQNSLSGELPRGGFWNLTKLEGFDGSDNELNGVIPDEFCRLKRLRSLHLYLNKLEGSLPECIGELENLSDVVLFNNSFSGRLPSGLGRNSRLEMIDVSFNRFSGEIPASLCRHGGLEELLMIYNLFSGGIPESLGDCLSLTRVRLGNNNLSGSVPFGLWGLPHASLLELAENSLSGSISKAISGAKNLSILLISGNRFSGSIPDAIGSLDNLGEFVASHNSFTGLIPASMVKLRKLGRLVLRNNQFYGEIPSGVGELKNLNELDLANNRFYGNIPSELGTLPGLNFLDLSGNCLSGEIPVELQNLKLDILNLSNNQLSGEIPPLYANENYRQSFVGNSGLYDGDNDISGVCSSLGEKENRNKKYVWVFRFIFVLAGVVLIVGLSWFYFKFRNFKKIRKSFHLSKWKSFHKLGFSEFEIVKLMSEDNVIGSGASGKVYKVVLSNGEVVAVKKLWGATKMMENGNFDDGYEVEVETLGKIRHKNIVRLWCCCNSGDNKLLVYEYMPNGSLADLLHSSKKNLLDWPTRLKIAIDAAEGLSYLHHDCVPPIVHRDVKSSNILLDGEFGAKVADFGVAKFIRGVSHGAEPMSMIAGSYGYIAPEYAYTLQVNEKSDIYSFGVVILELVTGKPPLDQEYGEKDLVKWVSSTMDHEGQDQVIDPSLDSKYKEEISKVLRVGLLCLNSLPITRPSMRKVVKMLQQTAVSKSRSGKLSPYYQQEEE